MPRAVIAPVRVVVPLREATFARGLVVAGAGAASFVVARALLGVGLPTGRGETRVDVLANECVYSLDHARFALWALLGPMLACHRKYGASMP